jgi:hypothetical protein
MSSSAHILRFNRSERVGVTNTCGSSLVDSPLVGPRLVYEVTLRRKMSGIFLMGGKHEESHSLLAFTILMAGFASADAIGFDNDFLSGDDLSLTDYSTVVL